ncbi:MAG: hypothetical protein Q4D76_17310 [Oscillospiraceae bacterium]|nr:hypothetical protein [Oscillospiraceae bacterium]
MSRFLIEEVKREHYEFGDDGGLVVAVKYNCDSESKWIINDSALGISNFHESTEDISDRFLEVGKLEGDKFNEWINLSDDTTISEFWGFKFEECENDDLVNELACAEEDEVISLLKYVMHLTVCDDSEADDIIKHGVGKYSDEI